MESVITKYLTLKNFTEHKDNYLTETTGSYIMLSVDKDNR